MEENQVVDTPAPVAEDQKASETVLQSFTAEDLAKARAQEKAKLYPQIEKMAAELETLKKEREEAAARKAAKKAEREKERLERENAIALLEKERKFQDLVNYRQQRIEQERDSIVPQLIDLVNGNTKDEIEASIESLKAKSSAIMLDVQQTVLSARQQMPGARVTAPASGPLDNDSEQQISTPDSIREMSMADYAKQRAKLLGAAANTTRGQGLFG